MMIDSIGNLVLSIILYFSSEYLYFEYFWRVLSIIIFMLSIIIIGVFSMSVVVNSPPFQDHFEITEEGVKRKQLQNLERNTLPHLLLCGFLLLSWSRTFPYIRLELSSVQQNVISFVVGTILMYFIVNETIENSQQKKSN
jgi:uncharacterized protein YneF (UPF0154 family)